MYFLKFSLFWARDREKFVIFPSGFSLPAGELVIFPYFSGFPSWRVAWACKGRVGSQCLRQPPSPRENYAPRIRQRSQNQPRLKKSKKRVCRGASNEVPADFPADSLKIICFLTLGESAGTLVALNRQFWIENRAIQNRAIRIVRFQSRSTHW